MEPKIYAIILNYNKKDDLAITINCILQLDYKNITILVVDNASTDSSISYIKNNFLNIETIENKENYGFAKGVNIGIRHALKNYADYILLANNDIYIQDNMIIHKLLLLFTKYRGISVGIVGPTEMNYYDEKRINNQGWILFEELENQGKTLNYYRKNVKINEITEAVRVVDFVSGSFMLIDAKIFNIIGLFDEAYYLYSEETDFSYRAWKAGFVSIIDKKSRIYHKEAATSGKGSIFSTYYRVRNRFYFLRKHKSTIPNYYSYFYFALFSLLISIFRHIIKGSMKLDYHQLAIARIKTLALYHFFINKLHQNQSIAP